jgi:predicted nucleic-acid-binding Zn-ribbon protein
MKNIHILSTDKPSRLAYDFDKLILNSKLLSPTLYKNQNIYITDDSKIKEVDWVLGDFPDNPIGKVISKYGQEFTAQSLNGNKHGLTEYDSKKIILTTDDQLIQNGIQAIDDEFLQWFVQNPSCEGVEVKRNYLGSKCLKCGFIENHDEVDTENCPKCSNTRYEHLYLHKIIIPQEKPKQLTDLEIAMKLEEIEREEWQQDAIEEAAINYAHNYFNMHETNNYQSLKQGFENGAKSDAAKDHWFKIFKEQDKNKYSEEDMIAIVEKSRATGLTAEYLILTEQFKKQNNEQ